MTIPNILTCIRVLLIPVFLVLAYQPSPKCAIWALVVYIVACCTDFVDGYLARKWHQITDFGKFMDPVADKILVLAALMIFVEQGTVPGWAAVIILGREFIVSSLRMVAAASGKVIAANAVVLSEIPPNATAVGVPARVVRIAGEKVDYASDVDQIHVTDPVQKELQALSSRLEWLEKMIDENTRSQNV